MSKDIDKCRKYCFLDKNNKSISGIQINTNLSEQNQDIITPVIKKRGRKKKIVNDNPIIEITTETEPENNNSEEKVSSLTNKRHKSRRRSLSSLCFISAKKESNVVLNCSGKWSV